MKTRAGMILGFIVMFGLVSRTEAATYSGGAGTASNPFQIGTAADWVTLTSTAADWTKQFILVADIDFGGAALDMVGTEYGTTTSFKGVLDGNGHVLRNGQVNQPTVENVGLFGYIGTGGRVFNLGVENVTVTGKKNVGGLVGYNDYGDILSCFDTSGVAGEYSVGGLVGINQSGTITACYSSGSILGTGGFGNALGGLTGTNQFGTVESCYATGAVTGNISVGGLVGDNLDGTITESYAFGAVTGTTHVGGLVGKNEGGTVTLSYWDINTSGQAASAVGEGRTTDDMTHPYAANTFMGWDFGDVWVADTDYSVNNGYPYLGAYVPPVEGEGEGEGESVEGETAEGELPEGESTEGETTEGEGAEGEGEGEEGGEARGCCKAPGKDLTPRDLVERTLGDWLLIGR